MHFKLQSILALVALVPLTIGSPLLRRDLPPAVVDNMSAIGAAAEAAIDAANALPDTVTTPDQIAVSLTCGCTNVNSHNICFKGRRRMLLRTEWCIQPSCSVYFCPFFPAFLPVFYHLKVKLYQTNGPLSSDDANALFFLAEAWIGDVTEALGIMATQTDTKLQDESIYPPILSDFVGLDTIFSSFKSAVAGVIPVSLCFFHLIH
jgi:hypothetical protein